MSLAHIVRQTALVLGLLSAVAGTAQAGMFTVTMTGQAVTPMLTVGAGFKPAPTTGSITEAPAARSSAGSARARAVGVLILMETIS